MNIRKMHYDFKRKLNKLDSQQYRNLKVPEIDIALNEAIELFIKIVAQPRYATMLGFETSQRTIDDIRTIVKNDVDLGTPTESYESYFLALPQDYLYYVGTSRLMIQQGTCEVKAEKVFLRQHDDDFQDSEFDKSSFIWREANIRFFDTGIKVFTSGEFEVTGMFLNYIRKPAKVNNSEDYPGGSYTDLEGNTLNTNVDCDLPSQTHSEIVDLAVAIVTGNLQIPDYQIKRDKLNMDQLM